MHLHFDYETLEGLSRGKGLSQIQNVFNAHISELTDYLGLQPLYQNIIINLLDKKRGKKEAYIPILDFGVVRVVQNSKLLMNIILSDNHEKFLPFILFREACYCFIPYERSDLVKICINQIVENYLSTLSASKDWRMLIRDSLVDRDFIYSELDRLQKFFKIEAKDPLESVTQFFFKEIRENILLCKNENIDRFYDIIFERYVFRTSRSLFSLEIIETLRIIIQIFYEVKSYLSLTDYQTFFKKYKENGRFDTDLSLRKFTENLQWINKCSSIAPSYDYSYSSIDLFLIMGTLKFNPLLEKAQIKKVIERWSFFYLSKSSTNNFALEISVTFHVPKVYLKDFLDYFNSMEEYGYIIKKKLYCLLNKTDFINLNYLADISNVKKIIDLNSVNYERKNEIEFNIEYPAVAYPPPLSIFNYTILERVRMVSVTGLTFDKRIETLNAIKEDVENELRKQKVITKELKNSLDKIINYPKLKHQSLQFLEKNKDQGFFYLYFQFNHVLNYINFIEDILNKHPEITNIYQLQKSLNSKLDSQIIEERILLQNEHIHKIIVRDFLSLYFRSVNLFKKEVEKVQALYNVLVACYNLKILDLNHIKKIIEVPHLAKDICHTREKRYDILFKSISSYKITNEKIESVIEAFLHHKPPVLKPMLINTILISMLVNYYPEILLEDTYEVHKKLKKLKSYFPRMYINKTKELYTDKNIIRVLIYSANIKEKGLFLSIFYSCFKDSLINYNRYFWRGLMRRVRYDARDFYDFENAEFFYSENLYKQILKYSRKILGDKLTNHKYLINNKIKELFWSEGKNMDDLIDAVKNRISLQDIDFNLKDLDGLLKFRKNIEHILGDHDKYLEKKAEKFFERYINSIKFLPVFQKFGFSQYYLYFRPFFYRSPTFDIDFRLLFINSFQNIKYPANIEPNQAIFCEYIFPFRTPNKSYLNWLAKSKKNVSEYCLFCKKKYYDIIHFNRNLTKEGWNYSSIRFKSYMQDILFNTSYDPKISEIREFDLNEKSESHIYGKGTQEYEYLTQIYNIHSIDIKSIIGTRQHSKINSIRGLLKKKLIFPYISLKNLDFQEKISIILPDLKQEINEKIIKIFSFFNVCRIYEIEGEFFIFGFQQERAFENGLLIEIWFPKCELDEFFDVFDLIFHYLEIKHYIILTDLVNGKSLLKSVYGNLEFLKDYNPLLNLKWNDKDKIWMNYKLFNEKFEPIYPDLIKKDKQ